MVVVIRVPKIRIDVAGHKCSGGNHTSPSGFISQWELLFIGRETLKCGFQFLQASIREGDVSGQIVDRIDSGGVLAQSFAAKIHTVEIGQCIKVLGQLNCAGGADGVFGKRRERRCRPRDGIPWRKSYDIWKLLLFQCP